METKSSLTTQNLKIEHYILGKTIGIGAFGKVKIAKHEFTQTDVAIKIINKKKMKDKNMGGRIKREIKLLRYFNHPNIIRLYEVLETQNDIFVIMEYAPKGELFELIAQNGRLTEEQARYLFRQIIAGVEYCHSNLVAHRDLKPENILIDEHRTIKIADFGLSNLMKDGKCMKTDCGSPNYAAPEVVSKKKYCGTEVDTWSCGVILFAMLSGYLPFEEEVLQRLFKKIKEADYEMPDFFSPTAQDLIRRMLQPNPLMRIRFHEMKYHPWLDQTVCLYLDPRHIRKYLHPTKVNEEIFKNIREKDFNYRDLADQKIKDAIKRKKDYSFVIGYNIMFDEIVKKHVMANLVEKAETEAKQRKMSDNLNLKDKVSPLKILTPTSSKNGSQLATNIKDQGWHYGLKFLNEPKTVMACLVDTLIELDITYQLRAGAWKIKCLYTNPNILEASTEASSGSNQSLVQAETASTQTQSQPTANTTTSNGSAPIYNGTSITGISPDKFTKREIGFKIQLYRLPDKQGVLVDIRRTKGHSICFLYFANKFREILSQNLVKQ